MIHLSKIERYGSPYKALGALASPFQRLKLSQQAYLRTILNTDNNNMSAVPIAHKFIKNSAHKTWPQLKEVFHVWHTGAVQPFLVGELAFGAAIYYAVENKMFRVLNPQGGETVRTMTPEWKAATENMRKGMPFTSCDRKAVHNPTFTASRPIKYIMGVKGPMDSTLPAQ